MAQQLIGSATEMMHQQAQRMRPLAPPARSSQRGHDSDILHLQRTLGNQRVTELIKSKRLTPEGKIIGLQPKLMVGAADDQYEQEADQVARQVMSMPDSAIVPTLQQKSTGGDGGSQ